MTITDWAELVGEHRTGTAGATERLVGLTTPAVLGTRWIRRWLPLLRASGWEVADLRALAAEAILTAATTYDVDRGPWLTHAVWAARTAIQRTPELRQYRRRADAGQSPAVRVSLTARDGRQWTPPGETPPPSSDEVDVARVLDAIDPAAARTLRRWAAGHPVPRDRRDRALARAREVLGLDRDLAKTVGA